MIDWQETYKARVSTPGKAIGSIRNGDCVVMSECAGVPLKIIDALVENKENYRDVRIYHMLTLGEGAHCKPDCHGHFRHITNFVGANTRNALSQSRADFIPAYFKDIPAMLGDQIPCDIAVVTATPPDPDGFCSLSLSCDYALAAVKKARTVIAETNDFLPYTFGKNRIHVSEIDHIVPCSYFPPEIPLPKITDTEIAIGRNCASLIEDGSTLQLGIGAIPDAVLLSLKEKKHLGIHTEMFSDGVIDLVEAGVIDGSKKTLHKGKLVATFLMGSRRLYDFVDQNPMVELYPVDYVNDPFVIGQNDKMVAINSCIEIDLMGQVASESLGLTQFSGTGGQVDYVRGAALSHGGKSIMAMPSTASKGRVSRIVPFLAEGAAITTSRNDVDYVVTEFGVARLRGKTLRERALSLINIAHPDFRESLLDAFKTRFTDFKQQ